METRTVIHNKLQMEEYDLYKHILNDGQYYNPASEHYPHESNPIISCDKCNRVQIPECMGWKEYDLCMRCVLEIRDAPTGFLDTNFIFDNNKEIKINHVVNHSDPFSEFEHFHRNKEQQRIFDMENERKKEKSKAYTTQTTIEFEPSGILY